MLNTGRQSRRRSDKTGSPTLTPARLARLLPFHLQVAPGGLITSAGPTLQKLAGGKTLVGAKLTDVARFRRPHMGADLSELARDGGQDVHLTLLGDQPIDLKGQSIALAPRHGVLFDLSPGIAIIDTVRRNGLTVSDFSPADLAVELLYLSEAQAAILTESRNLNARLAEARSAAENLALTDPLTGLWNRRAMRDLLTALVAARGAERFGLMHIDLDHFKAVNDTMGHAAGDHVLLVVADILRDQIRKGDLAARVGGDEFVVIFRDCPDAAVLDRIACRIIALFQRPIPFNDQICRISASIGTTLSDTYPAIGEVLDMDRLIDDADLATYASKNGGRGQHTPFQPALRQQRLT